MNKWKLSLFSVLLCKLRLRVMAMGGGGATHNLKLNVENRVAVNIMKEQSTCMEFIIQVCTQIIFPWLVWCTHSAQQ